jgi:hypothetical protein
MTHAVARRRFLMSVLASVLPTNPTLARKIGGVIFDDDILLVSGARLVLVGAGVFRFLFQRYYACALYLTAEPGATEAKLRVDAPRCIAMVMLRKVAAWEFLWGLDKGLKENTEHKRLEAMQDRVETLRRAIRALGSISKADRVSLQYEPESGTRIFLNGAAAGPPVAGKDLNDALVAVWVGPRPLDPQLKEALLGTIS